MFEFDDDDLTQPAPAEKATSPLSWFHKALLAIVFWPWVYSFALIIPEQLWPTTGSKIWVHLLVALFLTVLTGPPVWRWLMRGRYRAGTAFGTLGLTPILLLTFAWTSGDLPESLNELVNELVAIEEYNANKRIESLKSVVENAPLEQKTLPAVAAASLGPYSPPPSPQYQLAATAHRQQPTDTFSSCIYEIHDGQPSMRHEALTKLSRPANISHLAEDIVQKTILAVCENAASRQDDLDDLRSYFFASINHARNDVSRNQKRWSTCEYEEVIDPRPRLPTDRQHDALEKLRIVHNALCEMPEQTAQAIRLAALGLSHREIAEDLNISYDLSRKLVSDGRKHLRETTNITFH